MTIVIFFPFRLESIAVDAELQEKSLSELERLADILHESCAQAESEHIMRYTPIQFCLMLFTKWLNSKSLTFFDGTCT